MLNRHLLNPHTFTEQAEQLCGTVRLRDLDERIQSPDLIDDSDDTVLTYSLSGGTDRWQRPFLALSLSGSLKMCCQRCMNPVEIHLDENTQIVLFPDENQLDEAMLTDEELDGMVYTAELDVMSLLEDQILMALPIAPKHENCPVNQDDGDSAQAKNLGKPNPFAVLAGVKKSD